MILGNERARAFLPEGFRSDRLKPKHEVNRRLGSKNGREKSLPS